MVYCRGHPRIHHRHIGCINTSCFHTPSTSTAAIVTSTLHSTDLTIIATIIQFHPMIVDWRTDSSGMNGWFSTAHWLIKWHLVVNQMCWLVLATNLWKILHIRFFWRTQGECQIAIFIDGMEHAFPFLVTIAGVMEVNRMWLMGEFVIGPVTILVNWVDVVIETQSTKSHTTMQWIIWILHIVFDYMVSDFIRIRIYVLAKTWLNGSMAWVMTCSIP